MNKSLMLIAVMVASATTAQSRVDGQHSLSAEYGYILGKDTSGSMVKLGYGRVIGDKGFLGKAELSYQSYKVKYVEKQILPYTRYTLNVSAGYSYEGFHPLYLNAYLGGFAGYEIINSGNNRSPVYKAIIPAEMKGFTYGVVGSVEGEFMFSENFSATLGYSQQYDLKSKFSKTNGAILGGLKYNIN